jgi:hypothetical protein
MDFGNKELIRLILAITAGFFIGFSTLMIRYWDRGFSAQDIAAAYDTGYKEALIINPASDRLEIVCAALWFAGQVKE